MNYQTLDIVMNMGVSAITEHSITITKFGDGYQQRTSHGINNKSMTWSGAKTGDYVSTIKPICDFLDAHAGVTPFYWVDPHGDKRLYTCSSYPVSQLKANFWQVQLRLEPYFGI